MFTIRDFLHERWHGKALRRNMAMLILSGLAISALINADVMRVATALVIAFFTTRVVDTFIYERLFSRPKLFKINVSNLLSAFTDSTIFVLLAFGWDESTLSIIAIVAIAKILSGAAWSMISVQFGKTQKADSRRSF